MIIHELKENGIEEIIKNSFSIIKENNIDDIVSNKLPNIIEKRMAENVEDNYEIDELIDTKIFEAIKAKLKKIKIS